VAEGREGSLKELDGGGHASYKQFKHDQKRDMYLKNRGLKVLRIWNNELDENFNGVFDTIAELCGLI